MRYLTHGALLAAILLPGVGHAVTPPNDDWAGRINIPVGSLGAGFNNSQPDIIDATVESTDPLLVCKNGDPPQRGNTVWYRLDLTGQSTPVYLNSSALGYDSIVAVFTGSPGSFAPVTGACNDDGAASFAASLNGVRLAGGADYSIMVARPSQSLNIAILNFSARNAPQYQVSKTVDTLDGGCDADCSLREAVAASNSAPGAILLPAGDFTLSRTGASNENSNASGDLDVSSGMAIYGVGAGTRIVGVTGERVFDLEPANPSKTGQSVQYRQHFQLR